jgi:hypothetical protein
MSILNRSKYFYLDDFSIEERQHSGILRLGPLDEHPYWYVEFKKPLHQISKVVPTLVLDKILNSNVYLMLCNSHEAFHEVVEQVYQYVIFGLGVPADKIVLLSESADIHHEVKVVAARYNMPEIKCKWTRIFEHSVQTEKLIHLKDNADIVTLEDKPYDKKFLNFNRRWRLQRPTLVALLYSIGILDKGFVSLGPCDDNNNWSTVWAWMESQNSTNEETSKLLSDNKTAICNLPPMYLDYEDLTVNRPLIEADSTDRFYSNSYVSIVSETNFYKSQPGRFVSEKVFKPIAQRHPFVLVSVPRTLELLRELGYKTFSPWIDESYDLETDDNRRLLMVAREIERLSNLTVEELTAYLNGVRDICEHNLNVLLSKKTFMDDLN